MHVTRNVSRIAGYRILSGAMFLFGMSGILSAQAMPKPQTYQDLRAAHPDWVQVPGKLMRADCVHEVPNGARIVMGNDGQPTGDVMLNGQLYAHYDTCSEAPISTRHLAAAPGTPTQAPGTPSPTTGPPFSGWVEDSQEQLSLVTGDQISFESGIYNVPSAPSATGGTVFIFNGIAPAAQNWILQPVLQYGVSAAGGGNYWAAASWLVGPGVTMFSPLITVSAGDLFMGWSEEVGDGSEFGAEAYDNNTYADSELVIQNSGQHWTLAYEGVLEVYNVTSCSQLPASGSVYFYPNFVQYGYPGHDVTAPPAFTGEVFQSGCGDSTNVNNSADSLYLYF
jgi:hypothetical protein